MKSIPRQYLDEFLGQRTALMKSRIQLAAYLFTATFFTGSIIAMLVLKEKITFQLVTTWIGTILTSATALVLSKIVNTPRRSRLVAGIFMVMVLSVISKYYLDQNDPPAIAAMVYVFVFFAFSLIFPWRPSAIVGIALLHFLAYIIFLLNTGMFRFRKEMVPTELADYLTGFIILFLSFWVCIVVIKRIREWEIENFVLLKELEEKNLQMQEELKLANKVHARLIPKSTTTPLADIAVTYLPAFYMGGDYAKFHLLDDNKLLFIICDVTGHGVSAALLVNALHSEFEKLLKKHLEPGQILKILDRFISREFGDTNMFLTAFCGLLDYVTMKFTYSNYGHLPQYLYRVADSEVKPLNAQTSMVGLDLGSEDLFQAKASFNKGDQILLFTDGVTESRNEGGNEFGLKNLENFIRKNYMLEVKTFNKKLISELSSFTGQKFHDDIFVLNIRTK